MRKIREKMLEESKKLDYLKGIGFDVKDKQRSMDIREMKEKQFKKFDFFKKLNIEMDKVNSL